MPSAAEQTGQEKYVSIASLMLNALNKSASLSLKYVELLNNFASELHIFNLTMIKFKSMNRNHRQIVIQKKINRIFFSVILFIRRENEIEYFRTYTV